MLDLLDKNILIGILLFDMKILVLYIAAFTIAFLIKGDAYIKDDTSFDDVKILQRKMLLEGCRYINWLIGEKND